MKKNVRETSIISFLEIQEYKLGELQKKVLKIIKSSPFPLTDREIIKEIGIEGNSIRPRRNELMKLGILEEAGKRRCTITKKLALTWKSKGSRKLFRVIDENTMLQQEPIPSEEFYKLMKIMKEKGFRYNGSYEWKKIG